MIEPPRSRADASAMVATALQGGHPLDCVPAGPGCCARRWGGPASPLLRLDEARTVPVEVTA